ncbi:MAG: OmpH family outer membrane protein [Nocardiopsaceae bacterium]|nr:OmpH family outer membrane protein [Nocardiopsaceae bacterium]
MSDNGEQFNEEEAPSSADAAEKAETPLSRPSAVWRERSAAAAVAAWRSATGRLWVLPLVTGLAALLLGGSLGYLLHPGPTASDEYVSVVEERDAYSQQAEAELERADALEEELQPLKDQAAEFDEREDDLNDRENDLDGREEDLDEREEEISETETSIEENTFPGNGTYVVGEDIKAGTYRSDGTDSCYWARLSSTDGGFDSIITNSLGSGAQVVTIHAGDAAFETSRCGEWTRSD